MKRTAQTTGGASLQRDAASAAGAPELRRAIGSFVTGVAVVTTCVGDDVRGMTVNSLTSISLEPPTILVSLTIGARTTDAVLEAGRFAVSILSARQEHVARRFAVPGEDHFAGLPPTHRPDNLPVIPGALAYLVCRVTQTHRVADHRVILGHVDCVDHRDGEPLAFMSGRFGDWTARGSDPVAWFF